MKDQTSARKLADEMTKLTMLLIDSEKNPNTKNELLLITGDVLGALEVFTFANFSESEQEVIFSRARRGIEGFIEEEPKTRPE